MLVLLMYTLLSIFGVRLSNSVPKKGRDPSHSIYMLKVISTFQHLFKSISCSFSNRHSHALCKGSTCTRHSVTVLRFRLLCDLHFYVVVLVC